MMYQSEGEPVYTEAGKKTNGRANGVSVHPRALEGDGVLAQSLFCCILQLVGSFQGDNTMCPLDLIP